MEVEMSGKWGLDPFLTVGKGLVYIGNLTSQAVEERLYYALCNYGSCFWVHTICGENGESLGYAYAKFDDEDSAQAFLDSHEDLDSLNNGQPVCVMLSEMAACTRFCDAGKLAVSGFGEKMTNEKLLTTLGEHGKILRAEITMPGFAIVHFANEWSARKCTAALNGTKIDDETISICHYDRYPRYFPMNAKRVVLQPFNLEPDVDNEALKEKFAFLGQVYARIEKNADGTSRGCGYVYFERPAPDTPILLSCIAYETINGQIILVRAGCSTVYASHPKREMPTNCTAVRFHPTAAPKGPQGLHVVPQKYRQYTEGIDTCDMSDDAELPAFFLGAFTIHVSNLGVLNKTGLRDMFAKFGDVVFCTIKADDKTLDRYGMVTFRHHTEALTAVKEIHRQNKNLPEGDRLRAEIIDTFYLYHQRHSRRLLQAKYSGFVPNPQPSTPVGAPMSNPGPVVNNEMRQAELIRQQRMAMAEFEMLDDKNKLWLAEQQQQQMYAQQFVYQPVMGTGAPIYGVPYYYQHPPSYYAPVYSQPPQNQQMMYQPQMPVPGPAMGQYYYQPRQQGHYQYQIQPQGQQQSQQQNGQPDQQQNQQQPNQQKPNQQQPNKEQDPQQNEQQNQQQNQQPPNPQQNQQPQNQQPNQQEDQLQNQQQSAQPNQPPRRQQIHYRYQYQPRSQQQNYPQTPQQMQQMLHYQQHIQTLQQVPRPQEKFRARIAEKIAALFQRSSDAEKADMLQVALQVPMADLNDMLTHDHTFRSFFIRRAVAAARNKKK